MRRHEQAYERLGGAKVMTLPRRTWPAGGRPPQPDKHIPAAVIDHAGIGRLVVTLASTRGGRACSRLPNTPHYFSLFAWGHTFAFALAVCW